MVNSNTKAVLNGYVTVRSFGGVAMPVPVQNMLLRNYCDANDFEYALPMNEHKYENCFMQLFATLESISCGGHIGMCSVFMLPEAPILYSEFTDRVKSKGISIHCIFENITVTCADELKNLDKIISLRKIADEVDSKSQPIKEFISDNILKYRHQT